MSNATDASNNAANKATVLRLYQELFNNGDSSVIDAIIANDITIYDPIMGDMHGIEAFRQFFTVFRSAFPQQNTTVEMLVGEGEFVAALHTHNGVNNGDFMGMPATGRTIRVTGLELFRLRDGKIVELWRHDDDAGLMRQLGLVLVPASEATPA
jgi:steroid delta-isomerase-like uncharacterized protein